MIYVYKHIRKDNNEVFYIGIAKRKTRLSSSNNRNKYWHNVVNKCGYDVEIIEKGISWKEACEREKYWIKFYGRKDLNEGTLVNMTDGGEGVENYSHTDKTKKKLSITQNRLDSYDEKYIKQVLKEQGTTKAADIFNCSLLSIGKYKKRHNITFYSDLQLISFKEKSLKAAKLKTGKRILDAYTKKEIKDMIDKCGVVKAAPQLNVSGKTLINYCKEKKIKYEKKHDGVNRRRTFDNSKLIEIIKTKSITQAAKYFNTSTFVIRNYCKRNNIKI